LRDVRILTGVTQKDFVSSRFPDFKIETGPT
jgi:hypothetical protein